MAEKQISILLLAKNLASGPIGKVTKDLGKLGKVSSIAAGGLRTAGKAIAVGVGAAAIGVAAAVHAGVDSLVLLESAVTSVDGAIAQMGLTGQVTGAQVAAWANEIEGATQAAFDDKDIAAATAGLVRYGKVGPKNLRPAMVVMTDLAAKTGDVGSASTLLAKALADPAKAAGKLTRMGIVLTKAQQKQITTLVKAGKIEQAQAVLLDDIAASTKGAASAMNGPMKDAQQTLQDVVEDSQRALAEGFLPVLQRVSKGLSKALADPKTLAAIRSFGKGLAGAFDNLVTFAEKIDWGKIGSGLKMAADWGGKLVGAISKMPPEVLAAIVALGGLNKISGGAVSGIVGELGKGLIKGVLGITAGVVNVNGGVVNGPGGGLPGKGGGGVPGLPAAGGGGALAAIGGIAGFTAVAGAAALGLYYGIPSLIPSKKTGAVEPITVGGGSITGPMAGLVRSFTPALKPLADEQKRTSQALGKLPDIDRAIGNLSADTRSEGIAQRQAIARASANVKPPTVTVSTNVKVNVTTNSITKSATIQKRVGGGTGSRDANFKGGWQPA